MDGHIVVELRGMTAPAPEGPDVPILKECFASVPLMVLKPMFAIFLGQFFKILQRYDEWALLKGMSKEQAMK